jgi:protein-disulfide isomerase
MASERSGTSKGRRVLVPVVVAVLAGLAAIGLALTGNDSQAEPIVTVTTIRGVSSFADPMALGDPDAPVVMISYSEFQCPFCGRFARETEPDLVERFVDTGVLRIEWRDFPYLGEESILAAMAARAASEQGQFWPFHDELFTDQPQPNSGRLTTAFLEEIAVELGLDVEQFRSDMNSPETMSAIDADFDEALSVGVNGTPAFIINGEPVFGAQPTSVFVDVIERAAAVAAD